MISQATVRFLFFSCIFLVFVTSFGLAEFDLGQRQAWALDVLRHAPGLDALASASNFRAATLLGLGLSTLLAAMTGVLFLFVVFDRSRVLDLSKNLTGSQKFLYVTGALLVLLLPLLSPGSGGGPHQISYGFFELVGTNPFAFAIFTVFAYVYDTAVIVFIRCLLLSER